MMTTMKVSEIIILLLLLLLPCLVCARRVPEFATKTAAKSDGKDAEEENGANGHGGHLLIGLDCGLFARHDGVERNHACLVPVLTREVVSVAVVLMEASKQEEGRETSPEHHIDQAASLQHAAKTPHRKASKDGVASNSMNTSDLNLLITGVLVLCQNGAWVHHSLSSGEETCPLKSGSSVLCNLSFV